MLDISNIHKAYHHKKVLEKIDFSAKPGEIIGLVGENGAGKSTLLSILATLLQPDEGTIQLYGKNSNTDRAVYRQMIGYVPQDLALWESLTVKENMLFFEKLSWKRKSETALRSLCQQLQLDLWKEKVHTLSGGQKRKLNLAISLIHEPKLLLLDEPTVGIDMRSKQEITSYLQQLASQKQTIILYISHDMEELRTLCHSICCIGKDSFYRDFLASVNKPIIAF